MSQQTEVDYCVFEFSNLTVLTFIFHQAVIHDFPSVLWQLSELHSKFRYLSFPEVTTSLF